MCCRSGGTDSTDNRESERKRYNVITFCYYYFFFSKYNLLLRTVLCVSRSTFFYYLSSVFSPLFYRSRRSSTRISVRRTYTHYTHFTTTDSGKDITHNIDCVSRSFDSILPLIIRALCFDCGIQRRSAVVNCVPASLGGGGGQSQILIGKGGNYYFTFVVVHFVTLLLYHST